MIDLAAAEEVFAASRDCTVGIEEEFAVLDAASLDMVPRFEELRDLATADDPVLAESIAGELISSEIEIRSGRGEDFHDALRRQRDVRACDRLRPVLPLLLAISANSPYLDARDSGLHSARSQAFTKSFPRCGIPDAYGSWEAYREYIDFLIRTESIVEYTQVWWSIRPHLDFGTVEVRICDAQSLAAESEALICLIVACVAQALRDLDDGVPFADPPRRLVEETFWRAIRHGLDGNLIDLDRAEEYPAAEAVERLMAWTAPVRAELGIEPSFPALNGAQRQRRAIDAGASMQEVYAAAVRETSQTSVQRAEAAIRPE